MLTLYNSLTKKKETFTPITPGKVGLYTCGPTVYHYAHIGNLRSFIFEDILRRVLRYNGYEITHVMNITDVGHLTDDADEGEDKMEKGARREGKSAWDVAAFYTEAFLNDMDDLNILEPNIMPKATDHIPEQIAIVERLLEKGHAYETTDGIYFDTTTIKDYGKLVNLQKQALQPGARVDMGDKKHPHDFALWKFSKEGEQRQMAWDAFYRKGFPGWHIECSAMSMKYLGDHFDIHCGGIDHKPVHHTNEIAQSEAVTGKKPWVNYWLHNEFLNTGTGEKMAKSGNNFITLSTIKERGIEPLAYRYFLLQSHYRKQITFSWEALDAAQTALTRLRKAITDIADHAPGDPQLREEFTQVINDDLNMPEAVALLWRALKDQRIDMTMVIEFDKVFGLQLHTPAQEQTIILSEEVESLLAERQAARDAKDWQESDRLRDAIAELGYAVEDTADGQKVSTL